MTFRDQAWSNREGKLGDQAEAVFEEQCEELLGCNCVRYGLSRPPINVSKLPLMVRYTPDFLTVRGFVEVQGFGRDQLLKLKYDKFDALMAWNEIFDVMLFVYDSANQRSTLLTMADLITLMEHDAVEERVFVEGKRYAAIPADLFFDV